MCLFFFCTVSLATGKQGIPASHLLLQTYNCNFYALPKRHFEYLELAYFSVVSNRNNFLDQKNPENSKELPCSLKGCSLFLKETLHWRGQTVINHVFFKFIFFLMKKFYEGCFYCSSYFWLLGDKQQGFRR